MFVGVAAMPQKQQFSLWRKHGTWLASMRYGRVWGNGTDVGALDGWKPLTCEDDLVVYFDADHGRLSFAVNAQGSPDIDVPLGVDLVFVLELSPGNTMRVVI